MIVLQGRDAAITEGIGPHTIVRESPVMIETDVMMVAAGFILTVSTPAGAWHIVEDHLGMVRISHDVYREDWADVMHELTLRRAKESINEHLPDIMAEAAKQFGGIQ